MLEESIDYSWIGNYTIGIHPYVNGPIDFNLIDKNITFSQVIFFNYTDINSDVEMDSDDEYLDGESKIPYLYSNFDNFVILSENITKITFPRNFNHSIELENNFQLTHLTFGFYFNQPIKLPNNSQLTHLSFGQRFNQPICLTNKIIDLSFGNLFDQPIDLVDSITHLSFGNYFNHPLQLTNNSQLIYLKFGFRFNQPIQLTDNLTHVIFGKCFNKRIRMTNNSRLVDLTLGYYFARRINLPNIKYLNINCNNLRLIEKLPNSLEKIIIGDKFNLQLNDLPNSVKYIELNKNYDKPIGIIPANLKLIKCVHNYKYMDLLTNYKLESGKNFQIIEIIEEED